MTKALEQVIARHQYFDSPIWRNHRYFNSDAAFNYAIARIVRDGAEAAKEELQEKYEGELAVMRAADAKEQQRVIAARDEAWNAASEEAALAADHSFLGSMAAEKIRALKRNVENGQI